MLKILFYICTGLLSLGQFSRFGELGGSAVYLFDLAVIVFAVVGTFYFLISQRFKISKYLLAFFVFCLIGAISLAVNKFGLPEAEFLLAISYLGRLFSYILAANTVYNLLDQKMLTKKELFITFLYSGLFIAVAGFVQLVILPDFTVLDPVLGWDPHKNRLASTFFDPNFTGVYLTLVFTLIMFKERFLDKKELEEGKKWFIVAGSVIMTAIFLTYSRSTWGMLGVLILLYGLFRSRKMVFLALLIAFSAYFAVPRIQTRLAGITDPADSASFRLISWKNTLKIAQDNLFLGVGYNAFQKAQTEYGFLTPDTVKENSSTGSDSSLLLVLATTGVVGLLVYLIGLIYPLVQSKNLFSLAFILPLVLQSNFTNSLFYPQILWLWLGIVVYMDFNQTLSRT